MIDFELDSGQRQIKEMAHWFAESELRPRALDSDRAARTSDELLVKIHEMGLGGGEVPREYGGEGEGAGGGKDKSGVSRANRTQVVAVEEMAWGDPSILTTFPGPGLGGPPVKMTGTAEQKGRFFSIFKRGDPPRWGAYALTEAGAGSDVANIETTCRENGDCWILNGRKIFVTNGARASWVVVFATLDKSLGRAGHRAFVVEKGTPGFRVGRIEHKLGLRASETAELILEECRVPKDNLLGGPDHYAKSDKGGFTTAMKTFDSTRPLVAAMATGIAQAALDYTRAFARDAFMLSRPIPRYASIRDALVEMERKIEAARLLCWHAAWMADASQPNSKEASMCKMYAARVGQQVTSWGVQLMGGFGVLHERHIEKLFRDIKVFDIFEGTGQIQRLIIARRLMPDIRIS